jgi:uridine phosphorylase
MIASSELILNKDGSIYHLGLQPDQIGETIITVGDPERVAKLSRYFDKSEVKIRRREFVTHTGWIGKKRVSVISTGIGTDNIDIVLNELDALANIDLAKKCPKDKLMSLDLIRIGTTGGLQAEHGVGCFVASRAALGFDALMQFYDAPAQHEHPILNALRAHCKGLWDFPLRPYYAVGDKKMLDFFGEGHVKGITATNSGFYGPQGRQLRATPRQPAYLDILRDFEHENMQIVNLEMETAGIYGLAALLGHKAISLSVVLANRATGQFSKSPDQSVKKLIETTLERIEKW